MYGKLFLYTPRSGSKIFAQSQCPMAPRWAVETLSNGSHIIHYTAPLYKVPASTRSHRADVGSILKHVARSAGPSISPRSLLAWDDCGEISFVADEKSVMDIEGIVRKFGRGGGLIEAIQNAREEAEIFGSSGPDTRIFAPPVGVERALLLVTNHSCAHIYSNKNSASFDAGPATFGDLPTEHALSETHALLQVLWDGMSAPIPTEIEAEQIAAKFAMWMDWCDDEPHREEMRAMLLNPTGQELQDWANQFFSAHHRISLGWYPDYPAHWSEEDEAAPELTEEPAAEITPEPTEEEVAAAQKKNEEAAFAEVWREHLRGAVGHWMAANMHHPYAGLDTDSDVVVAHSATCRRVAGVWAGYSQMNWHTPDIFYRATDPWAIETYYPASLPPIPMNEEFGDSPNKDVWTEWLAALDPAQLLDFLTWMGIFYSQTSEMWEEIDLSNVTQKEWDVMSAISHTFPFPYRAVSGLDGHPTRHELTILPPRKTQDLNNNRRRLPPHKWNVIRRHFAALVKMAEHAPE